MVEFLCIVAGSVVAVAIWSIGYIQGVNLAIKGEQNDTII